MSFKESFTFGKNRTFLQALVVAGFFLLGIFAAVWLTGKFSGNNCGNSILLPEDAEKFFCGLNETFFNLCEDQERIHLISENGLADMRKLTTEIVAKRATDEAFFIGNLVTVVNQLEAWKEAFPRIHPFYAVKANCHPSILRTLAALGTGFDCASKDELHKVLSLGVSPNRIIYANPTKAKSYLKYAAEHHVDKMTFDNEAELHKVKEIYPEAKLVLRLDTNWYKDPLGSKFGATPEEAPTLLEIARDLGLNVIGVSFHVGTATKDVTEFSRMISFSYDVFQRAKEFGFEFNLLDVGGGFPAETGELFDNIVAELNSALENYFPVGESNVTIISEPGRYFAHRAFSLATQVYSKRIRAKFVEYWLNDGIYASFNDNVYKHRSGIERPQLLKATNGSEIGQKSLMWGQTCDSGDRIYYTEDFPELEVGDWLLFKNMGAYTLSASGNFNGFNPPTVYSFVTGGEWDMLRKNKNLFPR